MRRYLPILALLLMSAPAFAVNTWFIRTDGGTITQCVGTTNAPYPGTGTGQACAVNHLFWLVNQSTFNSWIVSAGDTIQYEDVGPYYHGQTLGGLGVSWPFCVGNAPNCVTPPLPNNVTINGFNSGSCPINPLLRTRLIGINGIDSFFIRQGEVGTDRECLDLSSATTCTNQGVGTMTITNTVLTLNVATYSWSYTFGANINTGEPITVSGTTNGGGVFNVVNQPIVSMTGQGSPSGTFTIAITPAHADVASAADSGTTAFAGACVAGVSNNAANGIIEQFGTAAGPSGSTLNNISIHGMSHNGIWGGKYNNDNYSNILLAGNGLNNWDKDPGGCGTGCEDTGTNNYSHITSIWAGAVEVTPNLGTIGGQGYNYAVAQPFNGSGDCIVMIASGGTANWSDLDTENCMQDGPDLLHLADDPSTNIIVNMTRVFSKNILGQAFKVGGKTANATAVVAIGNCNWVYADPYPLNPPGWNALVGFGSPGTCRASDGIAISMQDGYTFNGGNITNITDQQTAWDFGPPFAGPDCTNGAANCVINLTNTATMGFSSPINSLLPGGIFIGTTYNPFTGGSMSHTYWWQDRTAACPAGIPNTTSCTYADPKFTAESAINAMNIVPAVGSPLIAAGTTFTGQPTTDVFGRTFSNPLPIGAATPLIPVASPANLILKGNIIINGKVVLP